MLETQLKGIKKLTEKRRKKHVINMCIRDAHGRFVLAKTYWISHVLSVHEGGALGLLDAL